MTVYNYHVSIKVQIVYNIWGQEERKLELILKIKKTSRDILVVIVPLIKMIELNIKFWTLLEPKFRKKQNVRILKTHEETASQFIKEL